MDDVLLFLDGSIREARKMCVAPSSCKISMQLIRNDGVKSGSMATLFPFY